MLTVKDIPYVQSMFSTIRRKLAAIIMGVSAAALIFSGILIVFGQMAAFRRNLASDLVLQARVVANNSLAAVSFDDPNDAYLVLQTLAGQASLAYASISRADGSILATYRRDGFEESPEVFVSDGTYAFAQNWLLARVPIMLEGDRIGRVFLQSDLKQLVVFRRHVMGTVFASLVFVFLVSSLISYRLQAFISRPIERLTDVVRYVSRRRDYSIRAKLSSRDEVGVLANAFNDMLAEVQLRDDQLREREKRAQEYLDVAGVMIVAFDVDCLVTLINPKGCEILGYAEKDILGKNWFESFVPANVRKSVRQRFDGWIQDEYEAIRHCEGLICNAEGKERLIAWNICSIRDSEGHVRRMLLSGEDITDRREAEQREAALRDQLARAERMKSIGVLAGGVAHDLNNIIGPLVALPEFVLEDLQAATNYDVAAHEDVQQSLEIMQKSAQRAASVVQDLLAVSRRGHYKRLPIDLNNLPCLSDDSTSIRGLRDSYPHVTFEVRVCNEPLLVLGSENHLCRVVDNLLRNAADAIAEHGVVTVRTVKRHLYGTYEGYQTVPAGDYAVLVVEDDGCGMSHDTLNRIIEPFFTQKPQTGRSGSGLGLSIVHGIIDDHEGYLDVVSTEGEGTKVCFYLRLTEAQVGEAEPDRLALVYGVGQILVVDDEPGQRFLASSCLTRLGYTVGLAENGRSAVEMFAKLQEHEQPSPYDLVVLDMIMEPVFDGLDTLRAIRDMYPEQKALIVSGHAENDRLTAALGLGAQWLAKPYTINGLANAVAEMFPQKGES